MFTEQTWGLYIPSHLTSHSFFCSVCETLPFFTPVFVVLIPTLWWYMFSESHPVCVIALRSFRYITMFREICRTLTTSLCGRSTRSLFSCHSDIRKVQELGFDILLTHRSQLIDVFCWGCSSEFFLPVAWAHVVLQSEAPGSLPRKYLSTLSLKR